MLRYSTFKDRWSAAGAMGSVAAGAMGSVAAVAMAILQAETCRFSAKLKLQDGPMWRSFC